MWCLRETINETTATAIDQTVVINLCSFLCPTPKGHRCKKTFLRFFIQGTFFMFFNVFRLDALALSVIATATWLAGWLAGCLSQPVLYQND